MKILFALIAVAITNYMYAQGVTKNGEITNTTTSYVNRNGGIGNAGVNKNGKIVNAITNALNIDGVDDKVTIPNSSSLNISTYITMEAWVYATKNSGIQNVVSKSACSGGTNNGYIFPRTDDGWVNFCMYLVTGGGWKVVSYAFPSLNAWHHLAATYDGANIRLYLNGVLVKTQAATGGIAVNTNVLCIGVQPGCNEFFGGSVDEVRIWNIVRTQSEIQNAMSTELAGNEAGLVAYYNFNHGVAGGTNTGVTTLTDKTSNANNGTLNNFTLTGTTSNWISHP